MWTPDPAKIITAAEKAAAQSTATMSIYEQAIQAHVDAKPRERAFRDGVTLASYAASTNPAWQAEAWPSSPGATRCGAMPMPSLRRSWPASESDRQWRS